MGVVEAPVDALQFMKDSGLSLEEMIFYTLYGTFKPMPGTSTKVTAESKGKGSNVSNTAFEANMNDQTKRDVLRDWGLWVSDTMTWFSDITGRYMYGDNYISCGILMGDRYMEESSDVTFDRLDKARVGKAPKSQLNSLQLEFLENKYQNNPIQYWKYYVLFIAEPFMWDLVADVISWDIPMIDKLKKIYFDEWVCTLDDNYFLALPKDGVAQVLKKDLEAFIIDRYQKGIETDNLLFTTMGGSLNVGDNVTVEGNNALLPEHTGKTFKITALNSKYLTMVDDTGNTVNGYSRGMVKSQSGIRGGDAYGMR